MGFGGFGVELGEGGEGVGLEDGGGLGDVALGEGAYLGVHYFAWVGWLLVGVGALAEEVGEEVGVVGLEAYESEEEHVLLIGLELLAGESWIEVGGDGLEGGGVGVGGLEVGLVVVFYL